MYGEWKERLWKPLNARHCIQICNNKLYGIHTHAHISARCPSYIFTHIYLYFCVNKVPYDPEHSKQIGYILCLVNFKIILSSCHLLHASMLEWSHGFKFLSAAFTHTRWYWSGQVFKLNWKTSQSHCILCGYRSVISCSVPLLYHTRSFNDLLADGWCNNLHNLYI